MQKKREGNFNYNIYILSIYMSLLVKPTPVKKRIQYIGATYETTIK